MGEKCRSAYDAGVGLGLASYHASAGVDLLAITAALNTTRPARKKLVCPYGYLSQGTADSVYVNWENISYNTFVPIREQIETEIRDHSPIAANAFHIGMSIAIAEGATSSSGWVAWNTDFHAIRALALAWLAEAQLVMMHFFPPVFDSVLLQIVLHVVQSVYNESAHTALEQFRVACANTLSASSAVP